jgi:hypothetical protein
MSPQFSDVQRTPAELSANRRIGTDVLEDQRVEEDRRTNNDGDHERLSHFVPKDKLMEAIVNGTPVVALCGKVWVPSRDPEKYPVCPECKEIWESMRKGEDE